MPEIPEDFRNSMKAVRISRSGKAAIVKTADDRYLTVSLTTGEAFTEPSVELSDHTSFGSWRMVNEADEAAIVASLTPKTDITVEEPVASKKFRVPENVRAEINAALELAAESFTEDDLRHARSLAFNDSVGEPEVRWVSDFFDQYDTPQRLRGGYKGQKWASKIIQSDLPEDSGDVESDESLGHDFDNDQLDYYGIGNDPESTGVHTLIAVDFDTHEVYVWDGTGFEQSDASIADIDEPLVMPLDGDTASFVASRLADDPDCEPDVTDADPEERSLFGLADSELDYDDLYRRGSIIADASGYTPAERSLNARRQIRGPGGTFGGRQVEQGDELQAFKKAKLSDNPPLVADVAARIQQFLKDASATDESAAEPATAPAPVSAGAAPNPAPAEPEPAAAPTSSNATSGEPTGGPSGAAIYFAIVDPTDTTAVLEAIAIVKDSTGNPQAWIRTRGTWKNDPATLAKLTGPTPPPVIELTSPEPAKTVLAQVDKYDSNVAHFPTDPVPTKAPVTAAGFVIPGTELGIYSEEDIINAVSVFDTLEADAQFAAKQVIRTRTTALNRRDLLPADWRTISPKEEGEALASQSPLFSEFGDIIVAAGHPIQGAKGAERLKQYWTHGKGAAKIRWGTKGDLTRAHRHLAKYVGPVMAWGLAQNYHKSIFGMSNAHHDKLTGQR